MKNKSNKHRKSYNACSVNALPVDFGFNISQNLIVEAFPLNVHSDLTDGSIYFWRYHGLYWFSLSFPPSSPHGCRVINSVGFLSFRNALGGALQTTKSLGFRVANSYVVPLLRKLEV